MVIQRGREFTPGKVRGWGAIRAERSARRSNADSGSLSGERGLNGVMVPDRVWTWSGLTRRCQRDVAACGDPAAIVTQGWEHVCLRGLPEWADREEG